ncbi:MAG: hypothetical protein JXA67_21940 [Micromonosporaceae bacterium]|nr:hypothetical protein [Micromonosporaceae bacterium]
MATPSATMLRDDHQETLECGTTLNLYTHAPGDYESRVRGVFDDPDDDSLTA